MNSIGPFYAITTTDAGKVSGVGTSWTSVSNAQSSSNASDSNYSSPSIYASCTVTASNTDAFAWTGFGFNLTAGTISGIQFDLMLASSNVSGFIGGLYPVVAGSQSGTNQSSTNYINMTPTVYTFGGSSSLMGLSSLSLSQANASNFGVAFAAAIYTGSVTVKAYACRCTIYGTGLVNSGGTGTASIVQRRSNGLRAGSRSIA